MDKQTTNQDQFEVQRIINSMFMLSFELDKYIIANKIDMSQKSKTKVLESIEQVIEWHLNRIKPLLKK